VGYVNNKNEKNEAFWHSTAESPKLVLPNPGSDRVVHISEGPVKPAREKYRVVQYMSQNKSEKQTDK